MGETDDEVVATLADLARRRRRHRHHRPVPAAHHPPPAGGPLGGRPSEFAELEARRRGAGHRPRRGRPAHPRRATTPARPPTPPRSRRSSLDRRPNRSPRRSASADGPHVFDHLRDDLTALIAAQPMFFVAIARRRGRAATSTCRPRAATRSGCIDPNTVAYLDLTGSGAETIAHLRENGRLTIMFCSFGAEAATSCGCSGGARRAARPRRLRGPVGPRSPTNPGMRAIIRLDVDRGDHLVRLRRADDGARRAAAARSTSGPTARAPEELDEYRSQKNSVSHRRSPSARRLIPVPSGPWRNGSVTVLFEGGRYFEGPRWHDGTWWVSDFYRHTVSRVPPTARRRSSSRWRTSRRGWAGCPTGRCSWSSMKDHSCCGSPPTARSSTHADLSDVCGGHLNDLVVDASGRAFVGDFGFDLMGGGAPASASLKRVDPDGTVTVVAEDLQFPNGSVITPDGGDADRRRDVGQPLHRLRHRRRRLADQPAGVGRASARSRWATRSRSCWPRSWSRRTAARWTPRGTSGSPTGSAPGAAGGAGRGDRRRDRRRRAGWASTPARSVGTTAARC